MSRIRSSIGVDEPILVEAEKRRRDSRPEIGRGSIGGLRVQLMRMQDEARGVGWSEAVRVSAAEETERERVSEVWADSRGTSSA